MRTIEGVSRLFYREIKPGDLLKLQAESNISPTGGGARDLRFPHQPFESVMRKMFPRHATRDRRGESIEIRLGTVVWGDNHRHETELELWPPTEARPSEARIARIHEQAAFLGAPDLPEEERVILLIVQKSDGNLAVSYVRESTLKDARFNREIALAISHCLDVTPEEKAMVGFIDFETGESYCHYD